MAISSYSTTAASNTTISGINIAEGCAPSGINNAIRQMMADIKADVVTLTDTQTLTNKTLTSPVISGGTINISGGTINNAVIGGTTPAAATFTTLTASGDVTFPTQAAGDNSTKGATTAFVNAAGIPIRKVSVQSIISNSTYTPSSGMVYCLVEAIGGGGAGGGAGANGSGISPCGGGGGGEYRYRLCTAADIGVSQAVTIGAGGTGGASTGGNGGNTSVGVLLVANGGSGGSVIGHTTVWQGPYATGGSGGNGGSGGIGVNGSGGGTSLAWGPATGGIGGHGGSSGFMSGSAIGASTDADGATGVSYGGGGSGAVSNDSNVARNGGNGASGFVRITEYCTQ